MTASGVRSQSLLRRALIDERVGFVRMFGFMVEPVTGDEVGGLVGGVGPAV
jgi:hypothetical protein